MSKIDKNNKTNVIKNHSAESKVENIKMLYEMVGKSTASFATKLNYLIKGLNDNLKEIDNLINVCKQKKDEFEIKKREEIIQVEAAVEKQKIDPQVVEQQKVEKDINKDINNVVKAKINAEKNINKEENATKEIKKDEKIQKTKTASTQILPNIDHVRSKIFEIEKPSYIKGHFVPPTSFTSKNNHPQHVQKNDFQKKSNKSTGTQQKVHNILQNKPGLSNNKNKPKIIATPILTPSKNKYSEKKRQQYSPKTEDKKGINKRTLIRKGYLPDNFNEERRVIRKLKNKKNKQEVKYIPPKIENAIINTNNISVKLLSEKIGITVQEILKKLMTLGIMANINSIVDFDTMQLVADELGVKIGLKLDKTKEMQLSEAYDTDENNIEMQKRPPVIAVMGHVDHGKTSLLDFIRKTSVATNEAGGITQHIGAYIVDHKGEKITFIDTPGHEAFTQIRARGAKVTDIAILVVAADDGVMPQTIEAIDHAKAAEVPIIVAVNKMDKPNADLEKVKKTLANHNVVTVEWGGDQIFVPISAKTGQGIDKLLEEILFLSEYQELKASKTARAKGVIIEAKLDKGRGPIANVIVQNGTLKVSDFVISGTHYGKVRAMVDDKGKSIKEAGPSQPVSIVGFNDVPIAGETFHVVSEKFAKQIISERNTKIQSEMVSSTLQKISIDEILNKTSEKDIRELNIIIKADVQGTLEALKSSLNDLSTDDVKLHIVRAAVGAVNKSDIMLAEVSNSEIITFNHKEDSEIQNLAQKSNVKLRHYNIIYEVIDAIKEEIINKTEPKFQEEIIGHAEVRNVFKITNVGFVAGSYVLDGKIIKNCKVRVLRENELVHEGTITSLKRFKDDVKEVGTGFECGITISNFDLKVGDKLEAYILKNV